MRKTTTGSTIGSLDWTDNTDYWTVSRGKHRKLESKPVGVGLDIDQAYFDLEARLIQDKLVNKATT